MFVQRAILEPSTVRLFASSLNFFGRFYSYRNVGEDGPMLTHILEDHPRTDVSAINKHGEFLMSPSRIGSGTPSQMAFSWLKQGGMIPTTH